MSEQPPPSDRPPANDTAARIDRLADEVWRDAETALGDSDWSRVDDAAVAKLMTAALKLYAAKADVEQRTPKPLVGAYDEVVTPTEALTAVTEVLRALRLGPMEFGLWSRRRPEDHYLTEHDSQDY